MDKFTVILSIYLENNYEQLYSSPSDRTTKRKRNKIKQYTTQHSKRTRTKLGKRAFSVSGPVSWNALKIFIHQSMVGN